MIDLASGIGVNLDPPGREVSEKRLVNVKSIE